MRRDHEPDRAEYIIKKQAERKGKKAGDRLEAEPFCDQTAGKCVKKESCQISPRGAGEFGKTALETGEDRKSCGAEKQINQNADGTERPAENHRAEGDRESAKRHGNRTDGNGERAEDAEQCGHQGAARQRTDGKGTLQENTS